MYPRVGEKRRIDDINIEDEEAIGSLCRLSGRPVSPKSAMEQEKRIRREIANSNERRRMQSINAGFTALKLLLPKQDGEKLSKAAILQQTADYIYLLEQEKARLLNQNSELKRLVNLQNHSDGEGSPSGGDSPCGEDRSNGTGTPPPPNNVTSTTMTTPLPLTSSGVNGESVTEEIRREMVESRVNLDRERRQRLKLEEHIRGLEAEMYPEKIQEMSHQVKMDYITVDPQPNFKIEVKDENNSPCTSPPQQIVSSDIKMEAEHATYGEGIKEVYIQQNTLLKGGSNGITSHASLPVATPTNLCTTNVPNATMITTSCARSSAINSSPTTIVTVLPTNKVHNKSLSPILELTRVSEVESTEVCSPGTTVEYVEDGGTVALRNHTVLIVKPSNSCQKSLDTICEAIRHLEGDHMFPSEDQSVGPGIEEEVITEETFTVEEDLTHHSVPHDLHHYHHPANIVRSYDSSPGSNHSSHSNSPTSSIHSSHVNHHSLGGSMGHLTLHMIQPEPQEVPLELTTTHRVSNQTQYSSRDMIISSSEQTISSHSSHPTNLLNHSSRPGVIVVKHQ